MHFYLILMSIGKMQSGNNNCCYTKKGETSVTLLIRLLHGSIVVALILLIIWFIWYIGLEDKSGYFIRTRKVLDKFHSMKSKK